MWGWSHESITKFLRSSQSWYRRKVTMGNRLFWMKWELLYKPPEEICFWITNQLSVRIGLKLIMRINILLLHLFYMPHSGCFTCIFSIHPHKLSGRKSCLLFTNWETESMRGWVTHRRWHSHWELQLRTKERKWLQSPPSVFSFCFKRIYDKFYFVVQFYEF